MKHFSFLIVVLFSLHSNSQSVWFKHLDGFTARQSFIEGDTIITVGNKFSSDQKFKLIISKIKFDSTFISANIITSKNLDKDSTRGTVMRYMQGATLNNKNLYIGLSVVGNGKNDKAFLTKFNQNCQIIDTINCTKDTMSTTIENTIFINTNPIIFGFYYFYLSQLNTKLTSFISLYRNKNILPLKNYIDPSSSERWRIINTLINKQNNSTFFFGLQYQGDYAGAPRVWQDYIVEMDTLGNELWRVAPSNRDSINPEGMQMVQKSNGNLLVSWCDYWYRPYKNMIGSSQPQLNRRCTMWFAEIDPAGNILWRKNIRKYLSTKIKDTTQSLEHNKAIITQNGVIWTGNYSYYYNHSYLLKTDFNGNPIWYREYELYPKNTARQEFKPYDVTATSDGGYVLTGEYISYNGNIFPNGCQLATIIKVDSFGCLEPGCQKADSIPVSIKQTKYLQYCKVYPNPANEAVTIQLPFNKKGTYLLEIFSMTGKLIEKITIHESTELNTAKYNSGFYLFKLYNEQSYETHKISINH